MRKGCSVLPEKIAAAIADLATDAASFVHEPSCPSMTAVPPSDVWTSRRYQFGDHNADKLQLDIDASPDRERVSTAPA